MTTATKKSTIVVVEDEPILLKALNIELLGAGYNVLSASDGEAALDLITREKPDLVLLDLIIPKKSGFEVLEVIKANTATKRIPVVILSNLGADEDRAKGKKLGAADYFVKSSTDLSEVSKLVDKLLA